MAEMVSLSMVEMLDIVKMADVVVVDSRHGGGLWQKWCL